MKQAPAANASPAQPPPERGQRPRWRDMLFFKISIRLAFVAVAFLILQVLLVVRMYATNTPELDQLLISAEANRIADQYAHSKATPQTIPPALRSSIAPGTLRSFIIHERGGRVVARYNDGDLLMEDVAPRSFLVIRTQRETWGDRFLITGTRRMDVEGRTLWITVAIAGSGWRPFIPVILDEIRFHVIVPLVALSLLLLIFNFSVVRHALKPLKAAIDAVNRVDAAQTSTRIATTSSSWEAQALTQAVNHMLARLEGTLQMLGDFAGHAAHELRTPLAILTLGIRRLPDSAERAALLGDVQRMSRLVDQMLDMARAAALDIPADARADLGQIASDVAATMTPLAFSHNRSIVYDARGATTVRGLPDAIGRALRNLIDNAITHTPPGTAVMVVSGPGPMLSVRDHGPGIPAEKRDVISRRFSHIRRDDSGGVGMGLAIAAAIMGAHGGTIQIRDAEGGGGVVELRFPE